MNLDVGFFLLGNEFPSGVPATCQTHVYFLMYHVFPPITQLA